MSSLMPSKVTDQSLRNGSFLAGRYGLGMLVSLGNMLVLTWWIGPHAYGTFATAVGIAAFLASLARLGIDTYLLRCALPPSTRTVQVAGTLTLAISLILVIAGAISAPLLSRWLHTREFLLPYLVLLWCIPAAGLSGIPSAKLERELNFRTVAGIELCGQMMGLLVSAAMAWRGAGVWAPVAGQLAWQWSGFAGACFYAKFEPRLCFDNAEAREMLAYGFGLTASTRVWQLRTLVNPLLVGRLAGPEAVAFVAFAIRIAESLGSVRIAAGRVAIASLSRLQQSTQEFRGMLQRTLQLQLMTLGPLLCAVALLGPFLTQHVLGARWMPSLAIYPFVAAGVLVNSVYNLQASALFIMGRQWRVFEVYGVHVILLAVATLVLVPRAGIIGYGWAELLACIAYLLMQRNPAEQTRISYRKLVPLLGTFAGLLFAPLLGPACIKLWEIA
jgi:O-antigen/teichoic acid export membrane protein